MELQAEPEPPNDLDRRRDHFAAYPVTLNDDDPGWHVIKLTPVVGPASSVSGRTELADRPQGAERAVEMTEHRIGRRPGIVCDDGAQDLLVLGVGALRASGTARTECVM